MIRPLLLACLLLLSACASQAPLPPEVPHLKLPQQLHIQREQAGQRQDWLLVVQKEHRDLRWSLMDPLGIPLARQKLAKQKWKADGLLPPNPEARELFAALLFALTTEDQVRFDYPGVQLRAHGRSLDERWTVDYATEGFFRITLQDGVKYTVSPLEGKATK
ncbi:MAG TPA: DUF3261 domain-containing protein [Pseudomonas sp.]|uniref:DUF3261 domain-containing protein n=1 Tax=Pseudomonas sp. TaxID=306 RepID=UPI002ED94B87